MAPDDPSKTPLYVGILVVVVVAAFGLGFWARDAGPFADPKSEFETLKIVQDNYHAYNLKWLPEGHKIRIEIHTFDGLKVDVLLMNKENYEAYQEGPVFDYVEGGSGLNVANFTISYEIDQTDFYYWVIDNTEKPLGEGASAGQDVTVRAKVEI